MLNILIQETDLFFQAGLQSFFDDFFKHNFHRSITFHLALTNENVSQADIIVLSLCQGETLTCFPELLARQKGIVIGLVDDELRFSALPSCFQDIIFLPRRVSLDRISGVLFIAWFRTQLPGYTLNKKTCFDCQHKGLSRQQIRIMVNFYRGLSVVQTANALKMSEKTVFTHKYMMMQKFNLRSDYELIVLLRRLMEKKSRPNLLRDYLENNYAQQIT
ncbi:helix-turn-helix transcriptional regulator [Enterobacter hormaechei]|uniref:helix-turn-helix transcriptional regulator n=1 Tax=Enterobacter hormaechei TaxID=158836 RepID=UPI00211E716F|nr:LuxR C-terminal-related transcriptional regulator [Enterobacter hormaechei]MDV5204855.1 LuxR C-terminal-related transcriptional regulator [Enterobacter hormaechei]HBL5464055.1 response regulator transcription factor [Enterobacter hormaechei]HBL6465500.1 response regulator transcription factor [Enterobacter hormaechei]HBL6488780.1 response regulator transcription factor [Enterobacter hormaechei]HCU2166771.1 response regulator transcription factor [Enterobacter hormaechei]